MRETKQEERISPGQERIVKLLFKFRYLSTQLLADVLDIARRSAYEAIEVLVAKGYVDKVYETDYRYAKKPAYYFLSQKGVTLLRKLLETDGATVNTLYKNAAATEDFIAHSLVVARCYVALAAQLPKTTNIFTKTEINRFKQFPKNRPDLYINTPDGEEAIVVIMNDSPLYIVRKRLDEIITHSENEGWGGDRYPTICFVLRNSSDRNSFVYTTYQKLEGMGMDDDELPILAADISSLVKSQSPVWYTDTRATRKLFGSV